ncbi:MAG: Ulp1 family isopeptidase [Saprospiraceae bacterium]
MKKGCISFPKDLKLHSVNQDGKVFKHDSTGHNESGHSLLVKTVQSCSYGPKKSQRFVVRRAVDESFNAALRRGKKVDRVTPARLVSNSIAANYAQSIKDLPYCLISPTAPYEYPIGIEAISPVEHFKQQSDASTRQKMLLTAIHLYKFPWHASVRNLLLDGRLKAIITALSLYSPFDVKSALNAANECHQYKVDLGRYGSVFNVNIAVADVTRGVPSLTLNHFSLSPTREKDVYLLNEDGNWSALDNRIQQEFRGKLKTPTGVIEMSHRFDHCPPFAYLQLKSGSEFPLPVPFLNHKRGKEFEVFKELFDRMNRSTIGIPFWEKFSDEWNLRTAQEISKIPFGEPFDIMPKLPYHLKDYYEYQRKIKTPRFKKQLKPEFSEAFYEMVEKISELKDVPSPMKPVSRSTPPARIPTFPSLDTDYNIPGAKLQGRSLANPHIRDNPMAPHAPFNVLMESSAENSTENSTDWVNWRKICSKCCMPQKGNHATKKKICKAEKANRKIFDFSDYIGTEFDKRSNLDQAKKRKLKFTTVSGKRVRACKTAMTASAKNKQPIPPVSERKMQFSTEEHRFLSTHGPVISFLPELMPWELQQMQEKQSLINPDASVSRTHCIELRRRDWERLFVNGPILHGEKKTEPKDMWLNDELVNLYMINLKDLSKTRAVCRKGQADYFLNTHFYAKLSERVKAGEIAFGNVKRWFRRNKLWNFRRIFIPIHHNQSHWILVVCDLNDMTISLLDSSTFMEEEHQLEYCRKVFLFIQHKYKEDNKERMDVSQWRFFRRYGLLTIYPEPKISQEKRPNSTTTNKWV